MFILIIQNNDLTGAQNQALGVARVISDQLYGTDRIQTKAINPRRFISRFLPFLYKTGILALLLSALPGRHCWRLFFTGSLESRPDAIVSILGYSEYANVCLARFFNIPNIYIGVPKHFPSSAFSLIVKVNEKDDEKNIVSLYTTPSHILPHDISVTASVFRKKHDIENDAPLWCCLIGGNCKGYYYSEEDWRKLARFLKQSSEEMCVKWLVSTSRRTGNTAQSILQSELSGSPCLVDVIWWGEENQTPLSTYLSVADICFITEESLSMVSDSVSFGNPVYVLAPSSPPEKDADPRIEKLIVTLEKNSFLKRLNLEESNLVDEVKNSLDKIFKPSEDFFWYTRVRKAVEKLNFT